MKKIIFILALVLLTGCADNVPYQITSPYDLVGFWHGLWHGMTAPFAWFGSLFSDDIAIYAVYNNGGWYDFGFMVGIGGLTGSAGRR